MVYDFHTEAGIGGIVVTARRLDSEDNLEASGASDDTGLYSIEGLPPGEYTVRRGDAKGYRPEFTQRDRKNVSLDPGTTFDNVDFALLTGANLSGVVLDEDDDPVPDAKVTIGGGSGTHFFEATRSRENGVFQFDDLPPTGDLHLMAEKEGLASASHGPIELPSEGLSGVVIRMTAESRISGTAVDSLGQAVPEVNVWVFPEAYTRLSGPLTKTNDEGVFELQGVAPGKYTLKVNSRRWRQVSPKVVDVKRGERIADILLTLASNEELHAIAGRISDAYGNPVWGAKIVISGGTEVSRSVVSDENGFYSNKGFLEREYSISVTHPRHKKAHRMLEVPTSERVDFVLAGLCAISGRVLSAETGNPLTSFEVSHVSGREEQLVTTILSRFVKVHEQEGWFTLSVEPGKTTLVVRAPGYATTFSHYQLLEGQQIDNVVVELQDSSVVEGVVRNSTGELVGGAKVFFGPVPHVSWHTEYTAAQTGRDGEFYFDSFPAGPQLVSVYHPDYAVGFATVLVSGDKLQRSLSVQLREAESLELEIDFSE